MYEKSTLSKVNKVLLVVLLFLLSVVFAIHMNLKYELTSGGFVGRILSFITFNEYLKNYNLFSSPFDNYITENLQFNRLSLHAGNLLGLTLLFSILSQVTGNSPQYLMLVPFGVFFTLFAYYVLLRSIFNDYWISFLSMIYILFYILTSNDQLGGYISSWTFILFCLFLIINFKVLEKKTPELIASMFFIYIGLSLYWHTVEARALFFMFSFNIVILLFKRMKFKLSWSPSNTYSIFFAMLVTTLYFKNMIYGKAGYISNASLDNLIQSYFEWFQSIAAKIGIISIEAQTKSPFYYTSSSNNMLFGTYAGLLLIVLILLPIFISCIYDLKCIKVNIHKFNNLYCLKYSLLLTQLILMIAYGFAGGAGPAIIIHFFPIVSIIGIIQLKNYFSLCSQNKDSYISFFNKFKFKKLSKKLVFDKPVMLFLILLIILNCLYSAPFIMEKYKPTATYEDCTPASYWLIDNSNFVNYSSQLVLTDYVTAGKFLVLCSEKGLLLDYKTYSPLIYQLLTENDFRRSDGSYMIVNFKSIETPIMTDQGWTNLNPLLYYIDNIESNQELSKIYNDKLFIIYSQL